MNADPHYAEYLAAATGLCEQTPPPASRQTFAVGDYVSGTTCGKRWQGRIWNIEGDRLSIEIDGGWLAVSARDVTH
jgi:hypothetical protein